MKFVESIVLLPCHSLEDFPTHHEGPLAEGLLAAWSAQWHPALLAATGRLPGWRRADGPPEELADRLLFIPEAAESLLLAGWPSRAAAEGAHVVRKLKTRPEMVQAALAPLDGGDGGVSPDLAADFLALGVNYLLVELLTRQMRYMSNVDEIHLKNEAVAAAQNALAHDDEAARQRLKNCFEALAEARERFYPVDAYLVDLTLVAPSTLGAGLRHELASDAPINLLMSAEFLGPLAAQEPQTLDALRHALDRGAACIVGGDLCERELPLLPLETVLAGFVRGSELYRQALGRAPTVFARRRYGLSPALPMVLSRLGFTGALHFTLDDGQFPDGGQCKIRWEGLDASAVDALARLPLDASQTQTILGLPRKMGTSMDHDQVATVALAHWPGRACMFYEDMRRGSRYAKVLGRFIALDEYFEHTTRPGELTRHRADGYRAPYLKQAASRQEADPMSRIVRVHRQRQQLFAARALGAWSEALGAPADDTLAALPEDGVGAQASDVDAALLAARQTAAARLAGRLGLPVSPTGGGGAAAAVFNTGSAARSLLVDVSCLRALPDAGGAVVAAQQVGDRKFAVVDTPAQGFAVVAAGTGLPAAGTKRQKPMAEGHVLRNEFFEITVHDQTGGIRSVYDREGRQNRLSQQLALRTPGPRPKPGDFWRDPDEAAEYSQMVAESIEIVAAGPAYGEIVTRGRLIDAEGRKVAGFSQRLHAARGAQTFRVEIELDVARQPEADPWLSYYAARFALPDAEGELYRDQHLVAQPTGAKRIEAPGYVEHRTGKTRTTVFTGGLPYHRFLAPRMFDAMLLACGETSRRFVLGVGIDALHPAREALDLHDEPLAVPLAEPRPGQAATGWLFHLDAKNVVATHWQAVREQGRVVGAIVRLLECEGRPGRVNLRTFRPAARARQTDFLGKTLVEIVPAGDLLPIDLAACEWVQVEVSLEPRS